MRRAVVAQSNVKDIKPNALTFTTRFHELTLTDMGAGLAILTPEWDGIALVLTRGDVEKLGALCAVVTARP